MLKLKGLGFLACFICLSAMADKPVCVRDFQAKGKSACAASPGGYTWVYPEDPKAGKVCARVYSEFYCEQAPKEYNRVEALNGNTICVLNNNQPPVVNLCAETPQFYDYILEVAP